MTEQFVTLQSHSYPEDNQQFPVEIISLEVAPVPVSIEAISQERSRRLSHQFAEGMSDLGYSVTVLEGENNPFSDFANSVAIVDKDAMPDEPTVRLYRGLRPADGIQLTHQVSALLKRPVYNEDNGATDVVLESPEAFQAVAAFTQDPTYMNFKQALNSTQMTEGNRRYVNERLTLAQKDLIKHPEGTLLDALAYQHIQAPWGVATQDISPFVATSLEPQYAASSGGNSLMILDVPKSQIAGLGERGGRGQEVLVTGTIDPEWITAVAQLRNIREMPEDVLEPLTHIGGTPKPTDLDELKNTELHQKSVLSREADLKKINGDLIKDLVASTGNSAEGLSQALELAQVSNYRDALWAAADHLIQKLQSVGRYTHSGSVHDLYAHDEFNANDYLTAEPYKEHEKVRREIEKNGVLQPKEIIRLARFYEQVNSAQNNSEQA